MWEKIVDSTGFSIIYPLSLLLAVCYGYYIAHWYTRKKKTEWKASGIENSVIGIFGLLIAFTFSSSYATMKERQKVFYNTSVAVEDIWQHSRFLNDSLKKQMHTYLFRYLELMSNFKDGYQHNRIVLAGEMETIKAEYLTLIDSYAIKDDDHLRQAQAFAPYLNNLNNYTYNIFSSFSERTPKMIIAMLIIASWLTGIIVGFMNGFTTRHYIVPATFIIIVAFSIQIIRDLDNPFTGTIQPPFKDLQYQYKQLETTSTFKTSANHVRSH
jgi:hypothetical protein